MRRRRSARILLVMAAIVLTATPASAGSEGTTVTSRDEAWYQPNPTCASPVGCADTSVPGVPPPPLSPFAEGTLHVSVTAGGETARSYLFFDVKEGLSLASATLEVPLDMAEGSGTALPETARVAVCGFFGDVTDDPGSLAVPPIASCDAAVTATYQAGETPSLRADLGPLLEMLSGGAGLVLLPDASAAQPTDNWHIAFSASDRPDPATPPASLTVTYGAPPVPSSTSTPTPSPVIEPFQPSTDSLSIAPLAPEFDLAPPTAPVVEQPALGPAGSTVEGVLVTGFAYPWIVRLPLALLILAVVAGRALTGELQPRPTTTRHVL